MAGKVRPPAVAGQFYEGTREALLRRLEACYRHPLGPGAAQVADRPLARPVGFVVPHAGYVYSGPVAAHAFASLASMGRPAVAVILGPNHHGLGAYLGLSPHGAWQTPLGELETDLTLGERLSARMPRLSLSESSHSLEHSIEVQLPFLQHLYGPSLKVLPICMMDQSIETSRQLGEALAYVLEEREAVVLASSDFSHYVPASIAPQQDRYALDAIVALDPDRLGREVEEHGISMCGPGPVMAMLECMKRLGATEAKVLKYATSGDMTGDGGYVVAYTAVQVGPD